MGSQADPVAVKDTTAPLPATEKEGTVKTPQKSWVRSLNSFFKRKSVKASAKPQEEQIPSIVPFPEQGQNVEANPELPAQQKTQKVPPEPPGRQQTLAREAEVRNVDNKGASGKKRPYDSVSHADWPSTNVGDLSRVVDSGQHELESTRKALVDEMGEYRITGLRSTTGAVKSCRNNPQERRTSNAHTLFFKHEDLYIEAQLPVAEPKEKESNTGCLNVGKTSSEKGPEKVPNGKIIYNKAGGKAEDTITFEVSLNDSLMKEVLNSIQEGQLPVGLATCGQRGKSKKDYLGKCASSKAPDDTSDEFSLDIELCDPPAGNEENFGREHTDVNSVGGSSPYSLLPELVELIVRKQIGENDGDEKEARKSRYGASQEGGCHSKEVPHPTLAQTQVSASSDSALGSYSSHSIEVTEDKTRGPLNGSSSAGGQSRRPFTQSSSNIVRSQERRETGYGDNQEVDLAVGEILGRDRKARKNRRSNLSSNSSLGYQRSNVRSKGKRSYQLRDRDIMRDHMTRAQLKKQRCQKAEVQHSTFCSCMGPSRKQNTSSQGTDSSSARSGRYSVVDASTVSDDGSHSWKPRNVDDKCDVTKRNYVGSPSLKHYSPGKDEETMCTMNDDETPSCKTSNRENSTVMMSGPKRAKRAGWNLDRGADEHKTMGVDNERMATGIRKHQSCHPNIDPCGDSTKLSFRESKVSVVDSGDTFLHNVYISELQDSLTTEGSGAEYRNTWDDGYSGNSLPGKQVNGPKKKTCRCHLTENQKSTGSIPEQLRSAGGCGDGDSPSETADRDWNASTRDACYEDLEDKRVDEDVQSDQGPENKWLQRIGNLSVAQESNDYETQDRNGLIQHETDEFLPQQPQGGYLSSDSEEDWSEQPPIISESKSSHRQQDQTGEMPSYHQLQPSTEGCIEEQSTESEQTNFHGFLPQDEVDSEEESFTNDENWASNKDSKDHRIQVKTASFKLQHTGNRESVVQALEASQSLLQSIPGNGCCHVKSRFGMEGSLSSPSKVTKLREDPFSVERDDCDLTSEFSESWNTSMSAPKNSTTEDQATGDSHREDDRPIHFGHSQQHVERCAHAGPRKSVRCILAGAIKNGTKETHQQQAREESCRHEFNEKECKNEFMYSSELKRRKQDKASFEPDEEHVKNSQNVTQVLDDIHCNDLDDLKQMEASWKQCQKRYEAMRNRIEKISEQAHSGSVVCPDVTADSKKLDDQNQNSLTDSNTADKSSTQSNSQIQNLASCTCDHSQPETKLLRGKHKPSGRSLGDRAGRNNIFPKNTLKSIFKRNESEDSSSDDDVYDQVSKKFRDELFKRVPRENEQSLTVSSQILNVSCGDCIDQETSKKAHEVQSHLRNSTSSDPFRFSSIYKELQRVEQEMKEIARAFASYAHQEQTRYLEAHENSSNSRESQKKLKSTRNECKGRHIDGQDGGSQVVNESPPGLEQAFPISLHENPLWSKRMPSKTNSCGDPLSVLMAARLIDAEVPIDYENGYKVQYIPVDKRGNMGMRDKPPGWEERHKLFKLEERAELLRNSRPSADDSSSSSHGYPGGSPTMQIQGFIGDETDDSSSSESGSKLLHRRHQRKVSKEARCIQKQKFEGEDSDGTNKSSWSDDDRTNLDPFVGEAEEQLARLKLAKVHLGRLSPESLARVNTFYKKPLPKKSEKTASDPWNMETYEGESELSVGSQGKRVMRKMRSRYTGPTTPPMKNLTAREIKEFHLLERRVQRELGAAAKNSMPSTCQEQEGITKRSNEAADDNAIADQVLGPDQHHCTDVIDPSKVVLNAHAGNNSNCGASSPIEEHRMSSVVKRFFGAQREEPRTEERRPANNLQEVHHMIRRKVELLETEILHFSTGNRKIKTLLKEQDEHAARLKQDKAAWEQQKASDMEAFQKFRDTQMSKLQKERTKLEQQARSTISTLPRKEERRALDELKATLAQNQEAHSKKEEQWRLTSNRHRKANKELSDQTNDLRKEIRRLEQQILLQLDARDSPSDTSAKSFRKMARGRKERKNTESRLTDDITTAGSHLKIPRVNGNNSMIFEDSKPSKQAKCHIVNICDEATTMLAQKMKHLEKDVASWTRFHPNDNESEPIRY